MNTSWAYLENWAFWALDIAPTLDVPVLLVPILIEWNPEVYFWEVDSNCSLVFNWINLQMDHIWGLDSILIVTSIIDDFSINSIYFKFSAQAGIHRRTLKIYKTKFKIVFQNLRIFITPAIGILYKLEAAVFSAKYVR